MFKNRHLFVFIPLFFLSGCFNQRDYHTKYWKQAVEARTETRQQTITIWIHGTRAISKLIFPSFFRAIPGIHSVFDYSEGNNLYTIAQNLHFAAPREFPLENLYLFGWSGKLSVTARKKAAEELMNDLLQLIEQYRQHYGVSPRIRFITHSHGGNVALHLVQEKDKRNVPLHIDELIMLACPVQKRTAYLLKDSMFKKIYSLYSKADLVQVIDPQGLYALFDGTRKDTPFFSKRKFKNQPNLIQKKIKIDGKGISHLSFILEDFVKGLPEILEQLKKKGASFR